MKRLVLAVFCAAVLGMPAESGAAVPAPSPCLAGYYCATVTVNVMGASNGYLPGDGRVTSEPAGIDCRARRSVQSGVCSYTYSWKSSGPASREVMVTATAAANSSIFPSSGPPASLGNTFKHSLLIVNEVETSYYYRFNLAKWTLNVTKTGAGTGRVSSPGAINCGPVCSSLFDHDTTVALTATPDAGAVFKTWTGACNGQGATCTLTVTQAASTNAVFDVSGTSTPTPAPKPTPAPRADKSVDASVLAARATKTRLGARVVEVELAAEENLAVALTLARKGKKLALKRFDRVKEGRRVLTLVLPKTLRKGIATLQISADDSARNRKGWRRTVHVPSLDVRHRTLAVAPAPSPCLAGYYCAAITLDLTRLAKQTGGPGSGRVTSEPAGLDCTVKRGVQSGVCTHTFAWPVSSGSDLLKVDFTATPAADSWVGTGSIYAVGITVKARVMVENAHPVQVDSLTFNLPARHVSVTKTGAGSGRVSGPNGIDCGPICDTWVLDGARISLTAKADAGAVFKSWTGACNGQGTTCTLTATKAISTNAVFDVAAPPTTTPAPPADTSVHASVVAARAGKSRLGVRIVEVALDADEDVAVALTLSRKGKKLSFKRFAQVKEGRRVLTLVLPKTLRKGIATLGIAANDPAGNRKGWRRTVLVPPRTKVVRSIAAALAPVPPIDPCNSASCATLVVKAGGNGSGRVTSEPSGIDCIVTASVSSGTCEHRFLWPSSAGDLRVVLRLQPATGSIGDSPGGQYEWSTVGYHLSPGTTTLFNHTRFVLRKLQVSVTKSGAGTGRVIGTPGSIDCGSICKTTLDYGTKVTLTAKPDAGAVFKTWTGPCSGQGATCTLTVKQAVATNAVFDLTPPSTTTTTTTTTAADTSVDASLIAARAGKSRLRVRIVEVELAADEDLTVALTLARKGKTLALKRFARVKEGRRVLIFVLPKTLRRGPATLGIAASDSAGNRRLWTRSVRVPSASTRRTRSLAALAAAPTPCRARIAAAGHTWAVSTTNGVPCAAAGPIVRKLAAKTAPPPVGRYPGTHAGLVCVGRLPGKKPSLIICGTRSRGFTAVRA